MRRTLLVLAAALVAASAASAAPPSYSFANRAGFERNARAAFVATERSSKLLYDVKSLGCAVEKPGSVYLCAVVASGHAGVQTFAMTVACRSAYSGAARSCSVNIRPLS